MADDDKLREYLKRVLAEARQAKQRVLELEAERSEPVAIVGMACRLPGGVAGPDDLWRLVSGRGDGVSGFPQDRGWDLETLFDADPDKTGTSYVSQGGFLHEAGLFDPGFFGISPREAVAMDPQQRLLLEVSWEALEQAGLDPTSLKGVDVGVFSGVIGEGYATGGAIPPELEGFTGTGTTGSVASGRVSYVFGFEGPAVTVDTACSSSLVAIHLAAQALRQGECSLALAGGATVMAGPGMFMEFSRQRALAADGRCKSYAEAADGTGWAEGAGVVVLERLSVARERGHRVLAVVRGSAVNQDGASNGLTAPNGPSQQRVIRRALASAGVSVTDVDVVEGHGTGTVLGDPIEAQALLATYGQGRDPERPLWLGSLKSNIGHTQAAAGVAGVIKMIQAMRHGVLPPTLHVDEPSKQVDWSLGSVQLLTEARDWPRTGRPRRAGVSSFGVSGTNAHVIIEQAPAETTQEPDGAGGVVPLVLSARTAGSLAGAAERLAGFVDGADAPSLAGMAGGLVSGRAVLGERAVVIAESPAEAAAGFRSLVSGESAANVVSGSAAGPTKVVWVFPGQGSQWVGMGRELLDSSAVFAERIAECAHALGKWVDWSLTDVLRGEGDQGLLERVDVVQPASFAVMVGLAAVWASVGVVADAVVGHSQGEIAAACVAGALSLEDAARVVALRSQAIAASLSGLGGMASVALSEQEAVQRLAQWSDRVQVAVVNGPSSVVVAGDGEALTEALELLSAEGVRVRRVAVDYASHTSHVELIQADLERALGGLRAQPPVIPFYSTVTSRWLQDTDLLDAGYWYRNLRHQVRFGPAVADLLDQGYGVYVEASAHPVLVQPITDLVDTQQADAVVIGSLRRDEGGLRRLLTSMAELFVRGVAVDWTGVLPPEATAVRVDLPTYAFDHQHYWLRTGPTTDATSLGQAGADHPLLGAVVRLPQSDGLVFTSRLSLRTHSWLADHAVQGAVLLPASALVELAVRAGDEFGCTVLDELEISAPPAVPESGGLRVQVAVGGARDDGSRTVEVYCLREDAAHDDGNGGWSRHATGVVRPQPAQAIDTNTGFDFTVWPPENARRAGIEDFYDDLRDLGYAYGPTFQGVRAVWRRGEEVFADVALTEAQQEDAARFGVHPALLDAAAHPSLRDVAVGAVDQNQVWQACSWSGLTLHAAGATTLRVRMTRLASDTLSLEAADESGALVLAADSVVFRPVSADGPGAAPGAGADSLFRVDWTELPAVPVGAADGQPSWARVADAADVAALAASLGPAARGSAAAVLDAWSGDGEAGADDAVRALSCRVLEVVQAWLVAGGLEDARLVVATRGAMPAGADGAVTDPAGGAVWGLVRAAQAENPDRIVLVDIDPCDTGVDESALARVLAGGEPEVAVRGSSLLVPRLVRATESSAVPVSFDPDGTVLITGGTGSLGGLLARHLVTGHGVRHLLLASRRGSDADGAQDLVAELTRLGADVSVASCDVTDRDAVAALLAAVPHEHRLTGVVHTAGIADAGVIGTLTPERLAQVFAPKVTAVQHLDALTRELAPDLAAFIVFSSVSSVFLGAGTGSYAAANAFLDAVAHRRRAAGLPATSLAWGLWEQTTGMAAGMDEATRSRMNRRGGVSPITPAEGLELFDAALRADAALLVPAKLDLRALRADAAAGRGVQALLRGLVRAGRRQVRASGKGAGLLGRLAGLSVAEQEAVLSDLVRGQAARVLGHASPQDVQAETAFKDAGFDSLTSVELRNRLREATGLKLSATVVFDYPNPLAMARFLRAECEGEAAAPVAPPLAAVVAVGANEPVAIVGMACRLPGGVAGPEDLWRLVSEGRDAVSGFPVDRGWDLDGLFDADPDKMGASYVNQGGFLHDAGLFDAGFFGISPREALAMDPQQRLLLETSWEALERAGIDPAALKGADVGVFSGVMAEGYGSGGTVPAELEGFMGTGGMGSVASGRVSYVFGFEGPAVSVDTACSSSLVAIHLAAQALRQGECSLALAGGVTVMGTPGTFVEFSRQRGLAADGRCKSYADAADGTGWAEGAGIVVLERLSVARERGHRVLAVVRGSAVNQDGASNGLTAPNGPAQQRVIRKALASAGLTVTDVDVVEGHGTGTVLGDPIEAQALLATYGQGRDPERPLWLGSLKSNIGHAQAAAGIAGVIKMVEALRHGVLPPTLHVDEPSGQVDWSAGEVRLLTQAREWPDTGRARRAGVSGFGVSGTNAHVILEQVPEEENQATGRDEDGVVVPLVLSARSGGSLAGAAERLAGFVGGGDVSLAGVASGLVSDRGVFGERAVVVAGTAEEAAAGLRSLALGVSGLAAVRGSAREAGKIVFVFPGQGAQRVGMGQELYGRFPVFAQALDEVCGLLDEALTEWVGHTVREVVSGEAGTDRDLVNQTVFTQAGLFAVEVALVRLLDSWGVRPDAVIGHSIGELVGAWVAGVLTLADAVRVVAHRGRLMQGLEPGGAMVAVGLPEAEVSEFLGAEVEVAAVNGPSSVVLSGAQKDILDVAERLRARGVKTKLLPVSHAFHSARMEPMLADFAAELAQVTLREPTIPLLSNVTGQAAVPGLVSEPGYWVEQVRRPVRFADGVAAAVELGGTLFVELGPGAGLSSLVDEIAGSTCTAVLRDGRPEAQTVLTSVGELFVRGVDVDWAETLPSGAAAAAAGLDLPTYAFDHQHYWLQTTPAVDAASLGMAGADHPLLGAVLTLPQSDGLVFTSRLSLRTHPWLADHVVQGVVLVPGTGLVELAVRAGDEVGCAVLEELVVEAPLVVPATGAVQVQVAVGGPDENGSRSVHVYSLRQDATADSGPTAWTRHAAGTLAGRPAAAASAFDLAAWPPPGARPVPLDPEEFYRGLIQHGFEYGPAFQGLRAAWRRGDELFGEVVLPADQRAQAGLFGLHPALLDAALHTKGAAGPADRAEPGQDGRPALPFAWNGVTLHAAGAPALRVRIVPTGPDALALWAADESGRPVLTADSLVFRPVSADQLRTAAGGDAGSLFEVAWSELDRSSSADTTETRTWAQISTAADVAALTQEAATDESAAPALLIAEAFGSGDGTDALALSARILQVVQAWSADLTLTRSRLLVVTRGAVPAGGDASVTDPAGAAVWGLIRAAQAENPDRILLLDLDPAGPALTGDDLADLVRTSPADEPQLAVRAAARSAPRLVRATRRPDRQSSPTGFDPDGTVLLTGGTGSLGALLARHLVTRHGVRHLLLAGRRGPAAEGAQALLAELAELGAQASAVACDVSDRDAVAGLLAAVPAEHRLTAVIHTAGVLDDGVISSLTPSRLAGVFGPKADAVRHLDELTRAAAPDLAAFVVFSSAAGLFGSAGQGNYAAANAYLDARMAWRRAAGLPGTSLAWGLWNQEAGLTAGLGGAGRARMNRGGVLPLEPAEGLALFDAALGAEQCLLVPIKVDLWAVRSAAAAGGVPSLLRTLVPAARQTVRAAPGGVGLARRLAGLDPAGQQEAVLDLVRTEVAGVLGHAGADGIGAQTAFKDAGFDSLTSVELRNRLRAATGLKLSATVVFDYPTPAALARHIHGGLSPEAAASDPVVDEARLRQALATLPLARFREAGLLGALAELAAAADAGLPAAGIDADAEARSIAELSVEDLVDLALGSE